MSDNAIDLRSVKATKEWGIAVTNDGDLATENAALKHEHTLAQVNHLLWRVRDRLTDQFNGKVESWDIVWHWLAVTVCVDFGHRIQCAAYGLDQEAITSNPLYQGVSRMRIKKTYNYNLAPGVNGKNMEQTMETVLEMLAHDLELFMDACDQIQILVLGEILPGTIKSI